MIFEEVSKQASGLSRERASSEAKVLPALIQWGGTRGQSKEARVARTELAGESGRRDVSQRGLHGTS